MIFSRDLAVSSEEYVNTPTFYIAKLARTISHKSYDLSLYTISINICIFILSYNCSIETQVFLTFAMFVF
jgi:hypothetical protein